jgi:hypothetical protein
MTPTEELILRNEELILRNQITMMKAIEHLLKYFAGPMETVQDIEMAQRETELVVLIALRGDHDRKLEKEKS